MITCVYLSNLSPLWPFARQEKLLAEAVPGYPDSVRVWRDNLDPEDRRRHSTDQLGARQGMLRATTRKTEMAIHLASLAVLAWTAEDLLECITAASARRATIHVLDAQLAIPPGATADILHLAVKAFSEGRRKQAGHRAGSVGGKVSAERRSESAKLGAEKIRARWALSSEDYPTDKLLEEAGISRNTAKLYLGRRSDAQRIHQAGLKRAETAWAKRGRTK